MLRLTRLGVVAALRAAGPVPWLLALGWVAAAAVQEPRLLRGHGIQLVGEACWLAALALGAVLGASLRPPRATLPYLSAVSILTIITVLGMAVWAVGLEHLRGGAPVHALRLAPFACALTLAPLPLFTSLAVTVRTPPCWLAAGVAFLWTLAHVPAAAQVWSPPLGVASIACFGAAAVLAREHCRKHA